MLIYTHLGDNVREAIIKHQILIGWIEFHESDYDTRHHISKALNNLCEKSEENPELLGKEVAMQYY
jgi:hypothetical protein